MLKRKKGASNEPGATWACDTVWTASASRSLGKRMFTLSVITCVVFMGGGLKSSSLYGSTSSGLCVWCCFRPTVLVMTRAAEGGGETSWGVDPLSDYLRRYRCTWIFIGRDARRISLYPIRSHRYHPSTLARDPCVGLAAYKQPLPAGVSVRGARAWAVWTGLLGPTIASPALQSLAR